MVGYKPEVCVWINPIFKQQTIQEHTNKMIIVAHFSMGVGMDKILSFEQMENFQPVISTFDGIVAIVVGNSGESNVVFMNIEDGKVWKKILLSCEKFNTYDIIVSDLNGHGRLEIVEGNSDELNRYYFNRNQGG